MIKKLRFRFISVAMLATFLVLAIIMTAINVINYRGIVAEADGTLQILEEYDGNPPPKEEKEKNNSSNNEGEKHRSPEAHDAEGKEEEKAQSEESRVMESVRESRYFFVVLDAQGQALEIDIKHISAIDEETAVEMAQSVQDSGKLAGFSAEYRFLSTACEEGTRIIFLRSARSLENFWSFLKISLSISAVGLMAVFVLIVLLSRYIIRPVSESYEKQKRFITNAGHELKTPITIIDADAEVLEMEQGSNEWVRDIRVQSRRLRDLTEQMIFLSRMEEEQSAAKLIDFPLSDMVTEAVQSFTAPAMTVGKEFFQQVEPMISFQGDQKAIRQMVNVLLDNSVKYSTEGAVIDVRLFRQGRNICLAVTNPTDQLKKEDVSYLFDRFYRADKSRSSRTGGYGIGLSIAQAVATAHKGKISAVLAEDGKLTFTVQLPVPNGI